MRAYHLAIDIGASSGRHILGYLDGGKMRCEDIYRFPNGAKSGTNGLYWDTEELFRHILEGLKKAKQIGKIPSSVGIDTWAVDYALLDGEGKLIAPVYAYRNGRTQAVVEKVHSLMPFEEMYRRTGIQCQPFNTVYQLAADKACGRLGGAETMLMLPDYFHYLLTGVKKQEYTNATSTGLINTKTHVWDGEMLRAFALPERLFGPLSQPGESVGRFLPAIEKEVGYAAEVVLPATHDTASAVLAAPISGAAPYLSSGTWSLLGVEQAEAHTDDFSRGENFSNEGGLHGAFRYQKNIMGLWMIQSVKQELGDGYTFPLLAELARHNPNDYLVDCNDGAFLAPASMREAIENAVGKKLSVGETAYCIFNSLAHGYASAVKGIARVTGQQFSALHVIGGGSNNDLLNELTAKETGLPVVAGPSEATAIGNILMQMIARGEIGDIKEGRDIIKKSFDIKEII